LVQEGSVHDTNGEWFQRIVDGQDFSVGVGAQVIVNMFSEVGSDQIVIAILCV
jgi:hypothetical protein